MCSGRNLVHGTIFIGTVVIAWYFTEALQYTRVVETKYGLVRGVEVTSDGIKYKAFKGIPYAKPPIRELRFRAPEPPFKWNGIRNAVDYGSICIESTQVQISPSVSEVMLNVQNILTYVKRQIFSSEDCLSLNVFTTQLREKGSRPVLVFFPGGGFYLGEGTDTMYGPKYLVKEDIVVVTLNHRLGPLGFLSTNTSDASGNWGLKDQVAALKWVQENIAQFGGDPQRVTIYGESAGGVSAHLHLFSPLSRGLFHRVIASSGAATCSWALLTHQERFSKNLARVTGASEHEIEDPVARVRFLRSVKAEKLLKRMWDVMEKQDIVYQVARYIPFAPVVEPPGTQNAFLTEDPRKLLAEGKFTRVPILMGFNSLEAGVVFAGLSKISLREFGDMDLNVCKLLPDSLQSGIREKNGCPDVSRRILEVYFGGRKTSSSVQGTLNLLSDAAINIGVLQSQKWHAKYATANSSAYFYYFSYDGKWNIMKKWLHLDGFHGATHTDELSYIFDERIKWKPHLPSTSSEHITRKRMISFITNFVKHGNPDPAVSTLVPVKWIPATGSERNTMVIGEDLAMEKDILEDRMKLWNYMYENYADTPI